MKKVILFVLFIITLDECLSFFYGNIRYAFADETLSYTIQLRGQNHFTSDGIANTLITYSQQEPFLTPSKLITSNDSEIKGLAFSIVQKAQTNEEKSKAIYYWITHNIKYDVNKTPTGIFQTASETLKRKTGICGDYAILDAALHRAIGIEAKVVYGEDHAWNEIKINGKWIPQDTTFGSGYINTSTDQFTPSYNEKYFNYEEPLKESEFLW